MGSTTCSGGEGRAVEGPETNGTYVWFETDNWKRWEEKLMFGPYIHHVGGIYGNYKPVLREAARYLGLIFDDADRAGRLQFVREGRVMREIHPQALDREAFRPYGDFMDLLRVPQIERREGTTSLPRTF